MPWVKRTPLGEHLLGPLRGALAPPDLSVGTGYALTHASCFDLIKLLPDKSIDLIIIDPPYGHRKANRGKTLWPWDERWSSDEWQQLLLQVWRVLKPKGRFIVTCVRNFRDEVQRHVRPGGPAEVEQSPISCNPCTWIHDSKDNVQNPQYLNQASEDILVYFPTTNGKQLQLDESTRAEQNTIFYVRKDPKDACGGKSRSDGSMKPLALMRALVRTFEMSGNGVVLDFCMKTGVCGRGALLEGRRFIGVEANRDNFNKCLQVWDGFLAKHGGAVGILKY
jgi:hypothetical protein